MTKFWRVDGTATMSLNNAEADLSSDLESAPSSDELFESDGELVGRADPDSCDDDDCRGMVEKKRRFFSPVPTSSNSGERSSRLDQISKSAPTRQISHGSCPSKSASSTPKPSKKNGLSTGRKVLNMATTSTSSDPNLAVVLGDISNMLGKVMERTETKIESMERNLISQSLSSGTSGSDERRKVPTVVRVRYD